MFMPRLLIILLFSQWVYAAPQTPQLGKKATHKLIKHMDMDIFPSGRGLPKGQGIARRGKRIYQQYCLSCHGFKGTGASAEELAGALHGLTDNPPDKTIGTYWPYATTVFDFIRRSMPLNAPGVLDNNQLYAVTAYLLHLNGLVTINETINEKTLANIKMPNRHGFIDVYTKSIKQRKQ